MLAAGAVRLAFRPGLVDSSFLLVMPARLGRFGFRSLVRFRPDARFHRRLSRSRVGVLDESAESRDQVHVLDGLRPAVE